ncbi:MAG: hypothetical protein GY904_11910 [Planctomycetaceae bacterium]|nr:hypothetical protein [Planctomycetaceae bacterium]
MVNFDRYNPQPRIGKLPLRGFFLMLCGLLVTSGGLSKTQADILLPGHKPVKHVLVFEDVSPPPGQRLIVGPTRGLGGFEEIKPGEPFRFSNKYDTRIYLVPVDVSSQAWDQTSLRGWPNVIPPVSEINSVLIVSSVAEVITNLRYDGTVDGQPVIGVVSQVKLDSLGKVVSSTTFLLIMLLLAGGGLALCFYAARRLRVDSLQRPHAEQTKEVAPS